MTAEQQETLRRHLPAVRSAVRRYLRAGGRDVHRAESRFLLTAARAVLTWRPDGGRTMTGHVITALRYAGISRAAGYRRRVHLDALDYSVSLSDSGGDYSPLADRLAGGPPDPAAGGGEADTLRARLERWAEGIGRHFPDTLRWLMGPGAEGERQRDGAAARGLERRAFNERIRVVRDRLAKDMKEGLV